MIITNKHHLPDAMFKALSHNRGVPRLDRISVTELISPVQQRQLKIKHWDEIEEDCSQRLWALLGTAAHSVFEAQGGDKSEHYMEYTIDGITITGTADNIVGDELHDYKITSVYSCIKGIKPEWEAQANLYRFLYLTPKTGLLKKLFIYCVLRDWQEGKSHAGDNYPPIPFVALEVPLWSLEDTEAFIRAKIKEHTSGVAYECSSEERWESETKWAVTKKGNKRADKLFDNFLAAKAHANIKGKEFEITERIGESRRCKSYCQVSLFCPQWKKIQEAENGD
jgi:hypothetical protein